MVRGFIDGEDRIRVDLSQIWWKTVTVDEGPRRGDTDTLLFSSPDDLAGNNHLAVLEGFAATDGKFHRGRFQQPRRFICPDADQDA